MSPVRGVAVLRAFAAGIARKPGRFVVALIAGFIGLVAFGLASAAASPDVTIHSYSHLYFSPNGDRRRPAAGVKRTLLDTGENRRILTKAGTRHLLDTVTGARSGSWSGVGHGSATPSVAVVQLWLFRERVPRSPTLLLAAHHNDARVILAACQQNVVRSVSDRCRSRSSHTRTMADVVECATGELVEHRDTEGIDLRPGVPAPPACTDWPRL
jgi:hypothetical protein